MKGLYYFPDFLSEAQEAAIAKELSECEDWRGVSSSEASRRVLQFGRCYSYLREPLSAAAPLPISCIAIAEAIRERLNFETPPFAQMIVNEYMPGHGIASHIDNPRQFGDVIACITLLSGAEIEFSHLSKETLKLYAAARSLYIMSSEARFDWKHGISKRKKDAVESIVVQRSRRLSLTFRSVNEGS